MKKNVDLWKFLAAVAVVAIHISSSFWKFSTDPIITNIFTSITRFAVPTMFIFSGYFYYKSSNRLNSIKTNLFLYIQVYILTQGLSYITTELFGYKLSMVQLWYLLALIKLQLLFYLIDSRKILTLIFVGGVAANYVSGDLGNKYVLFIPCFSFGQILSTYELKENKKISIMLLLLVPILLYIQYINHYRQSSLYMQFVGALVASHALTMPNDNKIIRVLDRSRVLNTKYLRKYSTAIYLYQFVVLSTVTKIVKTLGLLKYPALQLFELLLVVSTIVVITYKRESREWA